jgi:plastocyanin
MRVRILSCLATGVLVAAGAGAAAPAASADCNTAQAASEQHVGQSSVEIAAGGLLQGDTFVPCNVTVSPGAAVHWTIGPGTMDHTVTSDSSAPGSFNFTNGGGTFTFTQAGTYFYYCMFHGTAGAPGTGMDGVVYVQGPGGTPPPPPPPPAPPKFAGVKLVSRTIHVTAKRIAGVRVTCPAGTVGSCSGRLTLKAGGGSAGRLATKSLSIAAGRTATVKLRLSHAEFRKLVRRRTLRLGLALDVHDGNGTDAGQPNATIRLKAPPKHQ